MYKSVETHDASVMEEPIVSYDVFRVLTDEARQRQASLKETKFPQTTSGIIGWRLTRPGARPLDKFKNYAMPLGDIYKTLKWPPGSVC